MSLFEAEWEGAVNRKIRQSENLPEFEAVPLWTKGRPHDLRIKRDIHGSNIIGPGIFLFRGCRAPQLNWRKGYQGIRYRDGYER